MPPRALPSCKRVFLLLFFAISLPAFAQDDADPARKSPSLTLPASSFPTAVLHSVYYLELKASGGLPPLKWKVVKGALPPGLDLEPTGAITGQPEQLGDFTFTVEVSDSSQPPQTQEHEFTIHVAAALSLQWKQPPTLNGDTISGAVELTNSTSDNFDMTVIVVAVNEYGKAFALGYQHFTLNRETTDLRVDFGSNVPAGNYIVHADAVAEVPQRDAIFRARLQTADPLNVPLIE